MGVGILNAMWEWLQELFWHMLYYMLLPFWILLDWLLSKLPAESAVDMAPFASGLAACNAWVPVNRAAAPFVAAFAFKVAFIVFKYIWKAIPTTG